MINKKEIILNPFLSFDITLNTDFKIYKPLIFLHGFKGFKDWGHYPLMAEELAEKGFAVFKLNFSKNGVIPPDLFSFNDLDAFGRNTISQELADVERLLDWIRNNDLSNRLIWDKLTLMGHSRGGATAVIFASMNNCIRYLITIAAVADLKRMLNPAKLEEWKDKGVIYVLNSRTNQQMPLYINLRNDFYENINNYDVLKAADKIKIPTLVLHGDSDEAVPLGDAYKFNQAIRSSQLVIMSGANHTFNGYHPFNEIHLPNKVKELLNNIVNFIK
jgi:pimeloyl-ACP methyl ester carboxylesterase